MADIYDGYIRLRLLDVVLNKNSSSVTANSEVPMEKVHYEAGANHKVQPSDSDSYYAVDLAIGMCS